MYIYKMYIYKISFSSQTNFISFYKFIFVYFHLTFDSYFRNVFLMIKFHIFLSNFFLNEACLRHVC